MKSTKFEKLNQLNEQLRLEWQERFEKDETIAKLKEDAKRADPTKQASIEALITQRQNEIKQQVKAQHSKRRKCENQQNQAD